MDVAKKLKRLANTPARRAVAHADALRDRRDWEAAADAYAKALALDARRDAVWVQYGHALKESGKVEEALAAYRRALELNGAKADTHLQLGHALKIDRQLGAAAESYLRAFELDPGMSHAFRELQTLALQGVPVPADRFEAVMMRLRPQPAPRPDLPGDAVPADLASALEALGARAGTGADRALLAEAATRVRTLVAAEPSEDAAVQAAACILFDASDLMHHFRHSRLPTGIQRVQLEIIREALSADPAGIRICASVDMRWVQIPAPLFQTLTDLATRHSEGDADQWRDAAMRLEIVLAAGPSCAFPTGAWLVNLGTSWHPDYLLKVRNAKREHGIRFVPFVHDLIPVRAPQFVLPELTREYVAWLPTVLDHADFFLANSQSTRSDLLAAAAELGHALCADEVVVVPLDARFRTPRPGEKEARDILRSIGLLGRPFVLFVGTVEPRKNHVGALRAWSRLIEALGPATPLLVCAGGRGWMNEDVDRLLAADEVLARHVRFLHGLSDVALSACYDACLFTLFPSHYEGWGLPITESLCHGKVPVAADNSSLPEAGGAFGVYFRSGSDDGLFDALCQLISDPGRRQALEQAIAEHFAPRPWRALADQIRDAVAARAAQPGLPFRSGVHTIRLGGLYAFSQNRSRRLRPGFLTGYALRMGEEWHASEDWGAWSRGPLVELAFLLPGSDPVRAHIGVRGVPGSTSTVTVLVDGQEVLETQVPESEIRWLPVLIAPGEGPIHVELRTDRLVNLADLTDGADGRTIGLGMLGVYACAAGDIAGRLAFVEALATGVLDPGMLHRPVPMAETPATQAAAPALVARPAPAPEPVREPAQLPERGAEPAPVPPPALREEIPMLPPAAEGTLILASAAEWDS